MLRKVEKIGRTKIFFYDELKNEWHSKNEWQV